ncbi:MAG: UvrD-helicase domain-containing protein [Alphaproteobacteria bacterium]|nr:UvrD-helicase domain-containing protein [Alphaproteobacteria bacterium]
MSPLDIEITSSDITALKEATGLVFDNVRSKILKSMDTIDVQACPGSGKTTLIASKLILLAQKWPYKYQGICVLSHTNVAKDEIIERIEKSRIPGAQKLLSYPHFIGTIQEFIDKYLGIPYLRSCGIHINLIDTQKCVELIYAKLDVGTRNYIDKRNNHSNVLFDFN